MLHAKFQDHRTSGSGRLFKVFAIYEHGGHLGHVNCTIYINLRFHFPRRLHMKRLCALVRVLASLEAKH